LIPGVMPKSSAFRMSSFIARVVANHITRTGGRQERAIFKPTLLRHPKEMLMLRDSFQQLC